MRIAKCIPSLVSLLRPVLAPWIFLSARDGNWLIGFYLLMISLASDYIDGYLAVKLDARTTWGKSIDRAGDFTMTLASIGGIFVSRDIPPIAGWLIAGIGLATLPISTLATFSPPSMHSPFICRLSATISPFLFIALMTIFAICFSIMALGVETTAILLVVACLLAPRAIRHKQHRIHTWIQNYQA